MKWDKPSMDEIVFARFFSKCTEKMYKILERKIFFFRIRPNAENRINVCLFVHFIDISFYYYYYCCCRRISIYIYLKEKYNKISILAFVRWENFHHVIRLQLINILARINKTIRPFYCCYDTISLLIVDNLI